MTAGLRQYEDAVKVQAVVMAVHDLDTCSMTYCVVIGLTCWHFSEATSQHREALAEQKLIPYS